MKISLLTGGDASPHYVLGLTEGLVGAGIAVDFIGSDATKGSGIVMRDLIYESIPMIISKSLVKWLKGISGKIIFEVDNDFNLRDTKTKHFIHKIFTYTIPLLSDELIKIREKNGVYIATFKHKPGFLMFVGLTSNSKISRSIQIIDLLIGCFKYGIDIDYNKMFIKKIC